MGGTISVTTGIDGQWAQWLVTLLLWHHYPTWGPTHDCTHHPSLSTHSWALAHTHIFLTDNHLYKVSTTEKCLCWTRVCVCVCVGVCSNSQVPSQKLSIVYHRAGLHIPDFLLAETICYIVSFPWSNEPPENEHPESHNVLNTNTHSDTQTHTYIHWIFPSSVFVINIDKGFKS